MDTDGKYNSNLKLGKQLLSFQVAGFVYPDIVFFYLLSVPDKDVVRTGFAITCQHNFNVRNVFRDALAGTSFLNFLCRGVLRFWVRSDGIMGCMLVLWDAVCLLISVISFVFYIIDSVAMKQVVNSLYVP